MNATDEERVMTRFLLGSLDDAQRERVLDRLTKESAYFEQMAATEDDLILRSLHDQLSAGDQELFAKAYLSSPARRARVEETRALLDAAKAWKERKAEHLWIRILQWLQAPIPIPAFAFGALIVATLSAGGYAARNAMRQPGTGELQPSRSAQPAVLSVELTVESARREAAPTMDLVMVPPDKDTLQLWFQLASTASGGQFEAELEAVDSRKVDQLSPPLMVRSPAGATAIVTIAAPLDGDYVIRVRRASGGSGDVVATHAFRVKRSQATVPKQ